MKILVTGANGMLGQDLCPILEDEDYDVIETDIHNLDFTNPDETEKVIKSCLPDYIIHLGAYTNVDKAEEEKEAAYKINVSGTQNIAGVCQKLGITLIYISTDYVFDGTKEGKYIPSDKPNPVNVYGETKLKGEEIVQQCDKYYIVRTSWLYGHHGKNFVETMISLADKPEIKVVNDQKGCPTWTVELSNGILDIIENKLPYGIYHVCGSGETTWYDFAKEIFRLTGMSVNLKECSSKEFQRPAKRPANSSMENNGILRDWKTALKEYIELRCE